MRKIILCAAAVTLSCGTVALADDHSNSSAGHAQRGHVRVIGLFSTTAQFKQLDLGDSGFSIGDEIVFADDLLTAKGGANAGADGGVCTVVRVDDATSVTGTLQCPVTLSLHNGQLFTVGLVHLANGALTGTQVVGIAGGTGEFRGAEGELTLKFLTPTETNYTITLTR
jgi:hypothetical protein